MIWRRLMEKIWIERKTNFEVIKEVKEKGKLKKIMKDRKIKIL